MTLETQKILAIVLIIFFVVPSTSSLCDSKEARYLCDHLPILNNEHCINSATAAKIARNTIVYHGRADKFILAQMEELYGEKNELLCYIFTLEPQGYIVVPAFKSLPPVLAYSYDSDSPKNEKGRNPFYQLLKTDIQLRLEHAQQTPPVILEKNERVWHERYWKKKPSELLNNFQQWPPRGTTSTGGWLETNWHQEEPFNNFCPLDMGTNQRSIAGCPAVTMAQIINYHGNMGTILFNDSDDYHHNYAGNRYIIDDDHEHFDFPSFPELNNYLDTLRNHYQMDIALTDQDKATLVFSLGIAAHQVYTSSVSGTFGVDQAYQAYTRFGIDDIELLKTVNTELFGRLRMNMVDGLPAHLAVVIPDWSGGHNLVVDGYNTDDYYHLNFGWGGSWNGWYLLPQELPYDLTVIEGVIIDIFNSYKGSDIYCQGHLYWGDISPGETIRSNFTIENRGDPESLLEWEITEWPEWGTWTFTPLRGKDLAPSDESIIVNISIAAPEKKNRVLNGYIKVINTNNDNDFFIIPVSMSTPKQWNIVLPPLLHFIIRLVNMSPLWNP